MDGSKGVHVMRFTGENGTGVAEAAGVSLRTLCRVLADMYAVTWIERDPQKILYDPQNRILSVATVVRRLTNNFFRALGLTQMLDRIANTSNNTDGIAASTS